MNLLVHAAHAIHGKLKEHSKGLIQVRTRKRGNLAEISIADNGAGIPEEIRSRVFDPFFTTKEVGKGTGQGMSMAYAVMVKKHSGKIYFESETGVGTTFFIEIPIDPAEHQSATPATQPSPVSSDQIYSLTLWQDFCRKISQKRRDSIGVLRNLPIAGLDSFVLNASNQLVDFVPSLGAH